MLGAFSNNLQSQTTDELVIKHAKEGNYYQLKQLLDNGANANTKDQDGLTALMNAAFNSNLEICQLLIDHRADVNAKHNKGWTALLCAVGSGNLEICQLLINHGANVNAKDDKGMTVLMAASHSDNLEICQLLINQGADVKAKDNKGFTAYDYANDRIKPLLLQSGSTSSDKLVCKLVVEGNYYQLKQLLENGTNANAKYNEEGWTALMFAASEGNTDICKLLINHGADVNAKNNYGWTALTVATDNGKREIIDLLLSKGANKADALKWSFLLPWNCVDNGYFNENCIDKVSFTIENLSNSPISSITFMLTITNKENSSVIYKRRHTIYMQLYPGEEKSCDPFHLAQPLYINASDCDFNIEFISAQ